MVKMRALGISAISLALTAVVVGNAYYQKKQFYPSVVYITKSNPSMAVSIYTLIENVRVRYLNHENVIIFYPSGAYEYYE